MSNKVHYDVKNVHLWPLAQADDGTFSFGEVHKEPSIMSLDLSAEGDQIKTRANGVDYYVTYSNNGYSGDMNFVMLSDAFKEKYLKESLHATDKVLTEHANAEPQAFAMAFEFVGDAKNRRHILYNGIASRPNIQGDNKDNQREPDTETLSTTFSPLDNGWVKSSTTDETPDEVFNNWFTTPYLPEDVTEPDDG